MDGVSHYVTVRSDIFTGLVASTNVPVTTLATSSIISETKPKVGKKFVKNVAVILRSFGLP